MRLRRWSRRGERGGEGLLDALVELLPDGLEGGLEQLDGIGDLPLERLAELLVDALLEFRVPLLLPEDELERAAP